MTNDWSVWAAPCSWRCNASGRFACIDWPKDRNQAIQFGRFLANPAVTVHEMLAAAGRLTNQRAAGRHVLAIMDTTKLDFPNHDASKHGFGNCGNGSHPGLFLHPVLGAPLRFGQQALGAQPGLQHLLERPQHWRRLLLPLVDRFGLSPAMLANRRVGQFQVTRNRTDALLADQMTTPDRQ